MDTLDTRRGFGFIPAVAQYSLGVVADPGHQLVHVVAPEGLAINAGLDWIEAELAARELESTALCAIELRSPEAMTDEQFAELNAAYRTRLSRLGVLLGEDNPVARTNGCPVTDAPGEPIVHGFTFVRPGADPAAATGFVTSGSAETREGDGPYLSRATAPGEDSEQALLTKATWVLGEMERRMASLGQGWQQCGVLNVYSRHRFAELDRLIAEHVGPQTEIVWWLVTPPLQGLEIEMDCRSAVEEPARAR